MSATGHGIGCGVVLGIVGVLLAQQLGYLDLSDLLPAATDLIIGLLVGAAIFGAIGYLIGRHSASSP